MNKKMNWLTKLPKTNIVNRDDFIISLCKEKKVLHLGFVDSGMLDERLNQGNWLHRKIISVASEVVGVDIDEKGINYARNIGINHVYFLDVQVPRIVKKDELFEVIVAGEIIEHLTNLYGFLEFVRQNLSPDGVLIVTTPNCMRYHSSLYALFGFESAHPDHTLSFSYKTLQNLLNRNGLSVEKTYVYDNREKFKPQKGAGLFKNILKEIQYVFDWLFHITFAQISPFLNDGLIMVARHEDNFSS